MKKLNNFFSILMVLLFTVLAIQTYNFFEQDIKYETQILNVNLEEFKHKWGNPDNQIIYEKDIVLFYNSSIVDGDCYVFKFDDATKNLKSKFYDD
jgi:mannitol-specific phosphotransferase system IIBC component